MSRAQRRWSAQEDSILQNEVEAQVTGNRPLLILVSLTSSKLTTRALFVACDGVVRNWSIIAQKIPGRSNKDCRKRFYNGVTRGLKKVSLPVQALWTKLNFHAIGIMDRRGRSVAGELRRHLRTHVGCHCPRDENPECRP